VEAFGPGLFIKLLRIVLLMEAIRSHSVSAANAYRRCSRLYYHQYVQGWQAVRKTSWLDFGTSIDQLLEVLDLTNLEHAISQIPTHFSNPFDQIDVEVLLRLWWKTFRNNPLPPHSIDHRAGNQFGFRLPFNGNEVTGLMSMTVSGYIDKVTLIAGDVGFMEGKTTSQAINDRSDYWSKLPMDPQIACYAWALSKEMGRPVNWCWYQVIRRPSQAADRAFSKTHKVKDKEIPYELEEYRARVNELLIKDTRNALVARKKVFISEEMKQAFITEHAQNYLDVQRRKEDETRLLENGLPGELAWPRNHFGCSMFGGCEFFDVCTGKTTIEGSGDFKKRIK
jgi:hypothetical protein